MANKDAIIKILLVIVVILAAILVTYVFTMNSVNADTFERVNLSSTCSLELPKIHFDEETISNNSTYSGVTVGGYSKLLTSEHISIQYTKSHISTGIIESGLSNESSEMKLGNSNWYSRYVSNPATGESVFIAGEDKEMVDKIADSIIFSKSDDKNITEDTQNIDASNNVNTEENDDTPFAYYNGRPVSEEEYNEIYNNQPHPDIWFEYHPGAPNPHEDAQDYESTY